jgi:hypothetical protein
MVRTSPYVIVRTDTKALRGFSRLERFDAYLASEEDENVLYDTASRRW